MGCLWRLIKLAVLLVALGFFFQVYGAKWALSFYLQHALGTEVRIEDARVDWVNAQAKFQNIIVRNPMIFPEGTLAAISHLYMDLDPFSLLRGRVVFRSLDLHVRELQLVRTPAGVNIQKLKPLRREGDMQSEKGGFFKGYSAKELVLSLETVVLIDHSAEKPVQSSFPARIRNVVFRNVESTAAVTKILSGEAMTAAGLGA